MGNEVVIRVTGSNDVKPALDAAKKDIKEFGNEAKVTAGKVGDVNASLAGTKAELKETKTELTEAAAAAGHIRTKIVELQRELVVLRKRLDETGDTGILGDIKEKERELSNWTRQAKAVGIKLGEEIKRGVFGTLADFGKDLGNALKAAKGPAIAGAIALGLTLTPFLGGAIAAAVVGSVGAGGIIGDILLAAQDPQVKAAGADFAQNFMHDWKKIGDLFVGPLVGSLKYLSGAASGWADKLEAGMQGLAAEVPVLARGLDGLVDESMPGVTQAMEAARVVLRLVANELPGLGAAISEMFSDMSSDPQAAALAMKQLFDLTEMLITGFGKVVAWLMKINKQAHDFGQDAAGGFEKFFRILSMGFPILKPIADLLGKMTGFWRDQSDAVDKTTFSTEQFTDGLGGVADAADKAEAELRALNSAIDDLLGKQMSYDEAALRFREGLFDLRKELTDGKRSLQEYTEEGEENRKALLRQIEAAIQLRKATVDQTGDLEGANAAYQNNIQSLYNMAIQAGFSKKALDELFAPYKNGPVIATTEFRYPGLLEQMEAMDRLRQMLGSYAGAAAALGPGQGTFHQGGDPNGGYNAPGRAHGGITGAEGGGARGGWTMVGERGRELVRLPFGSSVIPNGTTEAMMAGGAGGSSTVYVVIDLQGSDADLRKRIQKMTKVHGDGNVQVTFGQARNRGSS